METFQALPKQWGNSLGVVIPKEIVLRNHLSDKKEVMVIIRDQAVRRKLQQAFGTHRCTKPTQQIMDEIDEGYD